MSELAGLAAKLDPVRACLVLIDLCNDFLSPEGKTAQRSGRPLDTARAAIPNQRRLLDSARHADVPVYFVQHTTLADGASDSSSWLDARSRATYSVRDLCIEGTWGQQIVPELEPLPGEWIVKKYRYSGFTGTNLDLLLRSTKRETVVCSGISTNVCVESTARNAFELDYHVVLAADACASWDTTLHNATLATAGHRYATVTTVDEIVRIWFSASRV